MSTTKYIVNNVTGQTITDLTVSGNLVISGSSNVLPYKVYTALLTQIGGDDPFSITIPEPLVIGQSYQISQYNEGDDFTNVGAPSNTQDIWFVATGTTPAVWTNGSNLFTNGGAPVVIVLENTIGNIWFEYGGGPGLYKLFNENLTNPFKLYFNITSIEKKSFGFPWNDEDGFGGFILTSKLENGYWVRDNNLLYNTPIEIRVYN